MEAHSNIWVAIVVNIAIYIVVIAIGRYFFVAAIRPFDQDLSSQAIEAYLDPTQR